MLAWKRTPGFSPLSRALHALSDLRSRPLGAAFSAVSVSVAVMFLLALGFIGDSLYRYRVATVNESPTCRLLVSAKEATDPKQRLSRAQIDALAARYGAARAFPKVEVGGRIWTDPAKPIAATAEGSVADDPMVAPARLAWGRPPTASEEVVVPAALFRKLGGKVTETGPADDRLTLEVCRTTDGREEAHRVALRVVGLSRAADELLFIPLELALALDQWCNHGFDQMPGAAGPAARPRLAPAPVLAFGPVAHAGRVAADTDNLATVRKLHDFTLPNETDDVWLTIDGDDPAAPPGWQGEPSSAPTPTTPFKSRTKTAASLRSSCWPATTRAGATWRPPTAKSTRPRPTRCATRRARPGA